MNPFAWIGVGIVVVVAVAYAIGALGWLVTRGRSTLTYPIIILLWIAGQPAEHFLLGLRESKEEHRIVTREFGLSLLWCIGLLCIPFVFWYLFSFGSPTLEQSTYMMQKLLTWFGALIGAATLAQLLWMFHLLFPALPPGTKRKREAFVWYELANNWKVKLLAD